MLDYSREFMVLAKRLNYTVAANELNVSQPSLSRHIALLELEVGFRLFERNPMALTPAGSYYLESITELIEQLDLTTEHGRLIAQEGTEVISIAMLLPITDAPHSDLIYEAIDRMRSGNPRFFSRFYSDRAHTISEAVFSGEADIGILFDKPPSLPGGFALEWLIDQRAAAWLHESNPLLRSRPVRFEDLAHCKLVCSTNQHLSTYLDGMRFIFRKRGIEPKTRLKCADNLIDLVFDLRPDEVLLGANDSSKAVAQNSHLVIIKFDDSTLSNPVYLLYRNAPAKPAVSAFVRTCLQVAQAYRT